MALCAGIAGSLAFLWLFFVGVGVPVNASSLIFFFVCAITAALLIFNLRKTIAVSAAAAVASVAYSALVLLSRRGPAEYAVAAISAIYLVAAFYAYFRFGKARYLTPLDMPVYG